MADFFDHLWQQMHEPRSARDRMQYLGRLRSFIAEGSPTRILPRPAPASVNQVKMFQEPKLFDESGVWAFDRRHQLDFEPQWIRAAKEKDSHSFFVRLDPLRDEAEVLETRAMGADAYTIDVGALDTATVQFLIEVGVDFAFPALLICRHEEELARTLTIHKQAHILLVGDLAVPELLELELLSGRHVWFDARGTQVSARDVLPAPHTSLHFIYDALSFYDKGNDP